MGHTSEGGRLILNRGQAVHRGVQTAQGRAVTRPPLASSFGAGDPRHDLLRRAEDYTPNSSLRKGDEAMGTANAGPDEAAQDIPVPTRRRLLLATSVLGAFALLLVVGAVGWNMPSLPATMLASFLSG